MCFPSSSVLKIADMFHTMFLLQLYQVLKLYVLKPMVRVRFEKSCYPHLNFCFFGGSRSWRSNQLFNDTTDRTKSFR